MDSRNLLLMSLAKFYRGPNTMSQIIAIINSKSRVSLRLLDWHITNFSKKHSTVVQSQDGKNINIYISYRSQLKAYSKSKFDPFRRRSRIIFYYERDAFIETTVGQLNFFRWILQNNILKFLLENFEEIEQDMLASHLHKDDMTAQDFKRKRSELSKSFVNSINHTQGDYMVWFD